MPAASESTTATTAAGDQHARHGQERDRAEAVAQLSDIEPVTTFEDEPGQENGQDHLRRHVHAQARCDQDAAESNDNEQDGVRHADAPEDESADRRDSDEDDEQLDQPRR